MAATALEYCGLALRLLPPGRVWDSTRARLSELSRILLATGDEAARVDDKLGQLLDEMDPRSAHDVAEAGGGLLRDWEALYELDRGVLTPDQRRAALYARVTASGGGSRPQFLIDQASDVLGVTITLLELRSLRCGDNCRSSQILADTGIGMGTCWNWAFLVHAPAALSSDERTALESLIVGVTHARSCPVFVYDL